MEVVDKNFLFVLALLMISILCVLFIYREVPMKEAKEFAESIAAIFIETSARNAFNVEELFQKISRFLYAMIYLAFEFLLLKHIFVLFCHIMGQTHSSIFVSGIK